MATQRLANEIIQHIVDKLAEGPREECLRSLLACSTANSALLHTSQAHIFNEVTLYSHPTGTYEGLDSPIRGGIDTTAAIDASCERTRLFLRTIARNPNLCSHVKQLTYRFNAKSVHKSGFVLQAIRQLPKVVCLTVGIYALPNDHGISGIGVDEDTISTTVFLMRQPHLEALHLQAILGFPLEAIRASPGLRILSLREFAQSPGVYALQTDALVHMPNLETLVCDRASLHDGINFCLANEPSRQSLAILSRIQKIHLALQEEDVRDDLHVPLLRQVERLQEIRLTVHRTIRAGQVPGAWVSPLQHLNPSSFTTLSHLFISISTSLDSHRQAQGGLTILDPYLGLFDPPFDNFGSLETLSITLAMHGSLDVHVASSFGAQWGTLTNTLTRRGAFPKLKRVAVCLAIAAIDGSGTESQRENRPLSNLFSECFLHLVKPQFHALEVLSSEGVFDFSLILNVFDRDRFVQL